MPSNKHPLIPPNAKAVAKEPKSGGASLSPLNQKNGNGDQRIEFELNQDQMNDNQPRHSERDRLIVNDQEEKEKTSSCCGGKEGCIII